MLKQFDSQIEVVITELETLLIMCEKIDFLAKHKVEETLDGSSWQLFTKADIHNIFLEFRSLFDSIAKLIDPISQKPGQNSSSFHTMQTLCKTKEHAAIQRLGEPLYGLIIECDWFDQFRDVRDSIAHYGRDVDVRFLLPDQVIFQIALAKGDDEIVMPLDEFKFKNWVVLRPYIGFHLCAVIDLLDHVAEIAAVKLNLEPLEMGFNCCRHEAALLWMREAQSCLLNKKNEPNSQFAGG